MIRSAICLEFHAFFVQWVVIPSVSRHEYLKLTRPLILAGNRARCWVLSGGFPAGDLFLIHLRIQPSLSVWNDTNIIMSFTQFSKFGQIKIFICAVVKSLRSALVHVTSERADLDTRVHKSWLFYLCMAPYSHYTWPNHPKPYPYPNHNQYPPQPQPQNNVWTHKRPLNLQGPAKWPHIENIARRMSILGLIMSEMAVHKHTYTRSLCCVQIAAVKIVFYPD